jgi:hypothetical protein
MTPSKVIRRLLDAAPPVIAANTRVPNRCVLATAVGCATLERFGILAAPLPVDLCLANRAMAEWVEAGEPGGIEEATRRGAYCLDTRGGEVKVHIEGRQWERHLVVLLPEREQILDLDMQQLSRPARGIVVPAAAALEWPRGRLEGTWTLNGCTLYLRAHPDDRSFEGASDWQVFPELVGAVERAIRKGR